MRARNSFRSSKKLVTSLLFRQSVKGEMLLSLVEAFHCSCCQACTLPRSWVESRDWCRIAPGILQYITSGLELLACSFDTDFNSYNSILAKCFFTGIVVLRIFLRSHWSKNKQIRGSLTEPNRPRPRPLLPRPQLPWACLWRASKTFDPCFKNLL